MVIKKTRFEISLDEFIIILSYLHELSKIKFPQGQLTVFQIVSLPDSYKEVVEVEKFYEDANTGFNISFSKNTLVILRWMDAPCFLSFTSVKNEDNKETVYFGFNGEEIDDEPYDEELDGYELFQIILKEAFLKSEMHKEVFRYNGIYGSGIISNLKKVESEEIFDNNIYLSCFPTDQIEYFCNRVLKSAQSQRLLITGGPGVGKSQILENIIFHFIGDLLIVKIDGLNVDFGKLFEFLNIFDNSLLVIDDLDNFINSCETRNVFYDLLIMMDSFKKKKIHILASINENKFKCVKTNLAFKFDMIVNIKEIEPNSYMSLIKRETSNEEILTSMTESILLKMKERKVCGAFIVKFINHLEIEISNYAEINEDIASQHFDIMYQGFYREREEDQSQQESF